MRVGWSQMAIFASFARYTVYLWNLHIQGHNYYIVLCSPLTPKQMTLNDLEWSFSFKIWSELGIQWAGVQAFGENYSEI